MDTARVLETDDKDAFAKILRHQGLPSSRSTANRLIQPKGTPVERLLLERIAREGFENEALSSHLIDGTAAKSLHSRDLEGFLDRRAQLLNRSVRHLTDRMAAWGQNDRPSVDHLLEEAGVEV